MNNMDFSINIRSDIHEFERKLKDVPGGIGRASIRSINRTLTTLRAEGTRIARETYTAKAKTLRSGIRIFRATGKSPAGRITFRGSAGTPLYSFLVKPRKQNFKGVPVAKRKPWEGISAMIKKHGVFKTRYGLDGEKTFIATTRYGMTGVFYRRKEVGSRGGKLGMAFGPGPILALMNKSSKERLNKKGSEAFSKNLAHEVDAILRRITA